MKNRLLVEVAGKHSFTFSQWLCHRLRHVVNGRYYLLPLANGRAAGAWHLLIAGKLMVSDGCVWWIHGRWFSLAGGKTTRLGRFRAPRIPAEWP